jgi:hypothetical protein
VPTSRMFEESVGGVTSYRFAPFRIQISDACKTMQKRFRPLPPFSLSFVTHASVKDDSVPGAARSERTAGVASAVGNAIAVVAAVARSVI